MSARELDRGTEKQRSASCTPGPRAAVSYLWHIHRRRSVFGFGAGICSGTGRCAGPGCGSPPRCCSTAGLSSHSESPPLAPDPWPNLMGAPMSAPSVPWSTGTRGWKLRKHSTFSLLYRNCVPLSTLYHIELVASVFKIYISLSGLMKMLYGTFLKLKWVWKMETKFFRAKRIQILHWTQLVWFWWILDCPDETLKKL